MPKAITQAAAKLTTLTPWQAARRAGVPIVAIECPDPSATMLRLYQESNGKADAVAIVQHTLIGGLTPWINPKTGQPPGRAGVNYVNEVSPEPIVTTNPAECLSILAKTVPEGAIVYMLGAPREIEDGQGFNPSVCMGIWACRDRFKAAGATLVLLGAVFKLPPELQRDVVLLAEELPTEEELGAIVDSISGDADLPKPEGEQRAKIVDTLKGLAAFEAEQTYSMSLRPALKGPDLADLWERKVKAIEATPGLTVYRGKETLDDVGGLEYGKQLLGDTLRGLLRCSCIVFCDEIDKGLAAATSDSSGTTQDQVKALLSYMQDYDVLGVLKLGPPGTGKTLLAKALANTFGVPLILMDLGAMKAGLVGQSEANMRQAIKIIHAISGGRALFIGACNRDAGLPPELRRRFSYQLLFFDLPDDEEKRSAWKIHTLGLRFQGQRIALRPELADWQQINTDSWTGAEIRNCCLKAYAMDIPCSEAAKTIVPIAKSAGDVVESLRKTASGRYVSASKPGVYQYSPVAQATGRKIGGV